MLFLKFLALFLFAPGLVCLLVLAFGLSCWCWLQLLAAVTGR